MTVTTEARQGGYDAAYDSLLPYTQHAQIRAAVAEKVVDLLDRQLGVRSPAEAFDALVYEWPDRPVAVGRLGLSAAVQAAANAMEEER